MVRKTSFILIWMNWTFNRLRNPLIQAKSYILQKQPLLSLTNSIDKMKVDHNTIREICIHSCRGQRRLLNLKCNLIHLYSVRTVCQWMRGGSSRGRGCLQGDQYIDTNMYYHFQFGLNTDRYESTLAMKSLTSPESPRQRSMRRVSCCILTIWRISGER